MDEKKFDNNKSFAKNNFAIAFAVIYTAKRAKITDDDRALVTISEVIK